ncbi:protein kinase, putative [Leishmania donovani]|uniref:Protein kinase, putative n=1 Tax=Leishmania donovani TaxID=5661 RepID=A0A3Q8INX0_LEIDO|nr:protein kinase, putative [Leishmania donovani]
MTLNQFKSWPSKYPKSALEDTAPVRLRANSSTAASASPATAPATSTMPTSVLYSVLLRASVSRNAVSKNPAERSPHSHTVYDIDSTVREAVRAEVERLFPYRGAFAEPPGGADVDRATPAQRFFGLAPKAEEGERSGCRSACVARVNVYRHISEPDTHNPRAPVPSTTTAVAATETPSSSAARQTSTSVLQRLSGGPRVVIKSLKRKKTLAVMGATRVPAPSMPESAEAPKQLFAPLLAENSIGVGGVMRDQEASSCTSPSAVADNSHRFTVVSATELPDMQRHLERLFDDFAAAVEQCRAALDQQQLQSSSPAAWQTTKKKRGVASEEPSVSLLGEEASASQHPQQPPHCTNSNHRPGNSTVLSTDVFPRHNSHHPVSDFLSPDRIPDEWRHDHGTVATANGSCCTSYAQSASGESVRMADGSVPETTPSLEAEDFSTGIVMIAHTIAEHLHAILHPNITLAALEEEAAALRGQGHGGSSGAGGPAALNAVMATCRRSHTGAEGEDRKPMSPASFSSPSPLPDLRSSEGLQSPSGASSAPLGPRALRQLVHSLFWSRITAFLSSVSLKTPGKDCPMWLSTAAVEQREACSYVQLPFWIWLYAACGLATDVIRAQQEAQRDFTIPGQATGPRKTLTSSSATASAPPPPSLSQLLPTVETLARQLQRRQYERVDSTAGTLLTANTFLSFTGVQMTDKAVMKRLFPLQSGVIASDALGFATLSPHSAQCITHEASVATESSSGSLTTGAFDSAAVPTLISINTSSDRLISAEHTMSAFAGAGPNAIDRSSSSVEGAPISPSRRGQAATSVVLGDAGNTAAYATEEAPQVHSGSYSCPSTVELYLQWLESADAARLAACSSQSEAERFPDRADTEADAAGEAAASSPTSRPYRPGTIACMQPHVSSYAEDGQASNGDGNIARGNSSSGKDRSSSDSSFSYATVQRPSEPFRVAAVMPSAGLAPCLGRVEKELHQARSAVQFARKVGTLYATQDMKTLLQLLPAVAREEPVSPNANLVSARADGGAVESFGGAFPPRGGTDSTGTPAAPATPAEGVHSQYTWTGTPTTSNPMTGSLPPLVTPPQVAADRMPGNHALFFRRANASSTPPALFPSVTSPSLEKRLLMEHLDSCAAAIVSNSYELFVDSARALEVSFSLAVVLLSHVMGEAVPKGEVASVVQAAAVASSSDSSQSAISTKAGAVTTTMVVLKRLPAKVAAAALSEKSKGRVTTKTAAAPPPPRPLSMDLAKVFGFGRSRLWWQHLSAYVRETLISVALRALQRKDVAMTQELLQCITLDMTIAHHYDQVRRHHPVPKPARVKGVGDTKKVSGSTLKKSRSAFKAGGRKVTHLSAPPHESSASFVNVWLSSFAHLADTTTHLLHGDHNAPSSLKGAVWHLAGLAHYFLLTRARGYDMYGGQSHLCSTTLFGHGSGNSAGVGVRTSSVTSSAALQSFITSQLVEPAGKVLGVVVSFMESVCQALSADIESGGAAERHFREGVMFVDNSSDDESLFMCPAADDSVRLGSAAESTSLYSDGGGGDYDMASNRLETSGLQTCWMELAIHYFFEIVDVLLDAALHLPEKPLYLYQLTVSAFNTAAPSIDFADTLSAAVLAGGAGSPLLWGLGDLSSSVVATAPQVVADSPLDRVQEFLSTYTSMVLQSAVNYFTVDSRHAHSRVATARETPLNTSAAADGTSEDDWPRTFWERLLTSVAAPANPSALGEVILTARQPLTSASTPTSWPAANPAVSPEVSASSSYTRSTMWWPDVRFHRYSHLIRIVEHAQLVSLYLNSCAGSNPAQTAPLTSYLEVSRAPRDSAPSLQVSAVTSLLNTSTGPCAQLLSIPYACPPSAVDTSSSSIIPGSARTTSHERCWFHCTGSPADQSPPRFPAGAHRRVPADRAMREVCGGLWIRVELLRLLRLAAAPLDAETFVSFTKTASKVATQTRDRAMQTHYTAIASMKAGAESVLPKTYASTYVRLLFLRYVQAFYADVHALSASGPATGPDHTTSERVDGTSNATPLTRSVDQRAALATHADLSSHGDATPYRTLGPPQMRSQVSTLQHLSQRLWTHYCHELLWALRELCWSCAEAHETAANLSVASVFGRLLQMISGRGELEGDDVIDDYDDEPAEKFPDEPHLDLKDVGMSFITSERALEPYSTAEGVRMEGFVDFEVSSSNSSVTVVPGMSEGRKRLPGQPPNSGSSDDFERRLEPSRSARRSPVSKASVEVEQQVMVGISDQTSVFDFKERRRLGSNDHFISGGTQATVRSTTPLAASSTPVPTPPRTPVTAPPVVQKLSFTGLKPPLYFTSSGDTAAAQENDFYKEQSKQPQMAKEPMVHFLSTTGMSVVDAASHQSQDDDNGECDVKYEARSDALESASKHTLPKSTSHEPRESYSTANANADSATRRDAPKPPALTIPKLSLGALSPPLYFTSTGDTAVFAERPISPSLARPPAQAFPTLNSLTAAAPAVVGAAHVDPAVRGAPLKGAAEAANASTLTPPPVPVLHTSTPTTVDGFALPKLSFGSLGPPMYFTSTGDTGGFIEAENQKPHAVAGATTSAQIPSDTIHLQFGLTAQGMASRGTANTATATAAAITASNCPTAATAAAHFHGSHSSDESHLRPVFSFADFAPTGGKVSRSGNASDEVGSYAGCVDEQDSKERRRCDSGLSLNSLPMPESSPLSMLTGQRRRKRVPRTSRPVLTPIVAPAVTMELILCICSIILQQDSGMIQYAYTVSSLTQKRVLPDMSSSSQRRWHAGSGTAAAASGSTFTQKSDAAQTDRWRYTPQHSPSSFHVIQAMHNYLKDSRNSLVIDLLEEWVLDEYAEMERARMEQFESAYAPSMQQECSPQPPHPSYSHSESGGNIGNSVHHHSLHQPQAGGTGGGRSGKPSAAMLAGRYVLLRLLLPRAITPLITQQNERRIGAGGYGSVTSGFVQRPGTGGDTQLPPGWGQRGFRWRPAKTRGSTAASGSGAGVGGTTPQSLHMGRSVTTTAERIAPGVLDGLRAPWRTATQRIAQAVCKCEVAIKHIPLNVQGSESGNLPLCHAEVLCMYRLRGHPHIVPLLSFDNTKDEYILVLPHYTQGSLRLWRQKHYPLGCAVLTLSPGMKDSCKSGPMPTAAPATTSSTPTPAAAPSTSLFTTCARCLLQVLKGVAFMHDHRIRHGDIKCDNVLITATAASAARGEMDPPMLPSSVCLCDFGSCDTCDDDDIQNLKHDIMAGEARFLAGRWGVGRGTEAIQPPELMSAKRRYALLRRIATAVAPAAAATPATSSLLTLSERVERGSHAASFAGPSAEYLPLRSRGGELMESTGPQMTELLRRAELSVDIWACGCLLYEMLTGRMLFGEARLGRLLVLAAVDDGEDQDPETAASKTSTAAGPLPGAPRSLQKATVPTTSSVGADTGSSFTPSVSKKALDDWERRDLEAAVGKRVVDFMSTLLDLDPLQRPSAHEALQHWKTIMVEAGLEI